MAIFNKNKNENDNSIDMMVNAALSDPKEMDRVCAGLMKKVEDANNEYRAACDLFYASANEDRARRDARREELVKERRGYEEELETAQKLLGIAMLEGNRPGEEAETEAIKKIVAKIAGVDERIRIFDSAVAPLGSDKLYRAALEKRGLVDAEIRHYADFWVTFRKPLKEWIEGFYAARQQWALDIIVNDKDEISGDPTKCARFNFANPFSGWTYSLEHLAKIHSGKKED